LVGFSGLFTNDVHENAIFNALSSVILSTNHPGPQTWAFCAKELKISRKKKVKKLAKFLVQPRAQNPKII